MSFDTQAFSETVSDPRYDVLKSKIKIDKDNKAYELQLIPPATAAGSFTKTFTVAGTNSTISVQSGTCWNLDGTLHYIDVGLGSDFKANMNGTFLMLKYECLQARKLDGASAYIGPPIEDRSSMPWNPMWMFNTIALKGNQSQTPIEQYINSGQLHHITTLRYLQKYKSDALEGNDMTFLTPCIEDAFDTTTTTSATSIARAKTWMGASGNAAATGKTSKTYMKLIPLSDIFESCEVPAVWNNLNRFRIEFTFKLPDAIAFGPPPVVDNASDVYVVIRDVKLMLDTTRMTPSNALETAGEKRQGTMENIGRFENFCVPLSYSTGNQLVVTGQRDVQQVVVAFPAIGSVAGAANPIQYSNGKLTSLSCMYGSDLPLRSPITLGGANGGQINTMAYALYRKSCGADRAPIVPLALDFLSYYTCYNIYYIPIYNPAFPHRNNLPYDVRIDTNADAGTNNNVVICIRKFSGVQIDSTGAITVM